MTATKSDLRTVNPLRHIYLDPAGPCLKCGQTNIQVVADHIEACPGEHNWLPDGQLVCGLGLMVICEGPRTDN